MSVESLAIVLHHSKAKGTAKLVLVGIANHDGDGGAWPTVATLARYANTDPRSVQRALATLEKLGELRRSINGGGVGDLATFQRPNLYHLNIMCPADCDRTRHHRTRSSGALLDPVTLASPGDTVVTPGVTFASPAPLTPVSPKPSQELTTHLSRTKSPNRARPKASCGHDLVDDRHCGYGCPITIGATA